MIEVELLDKKHPSYDAEHWKKLEALYHGGQMFEDMIQEFLCQNPDEPMDRYSQRQEESYYRSYLGPIIDYYVAWLFSGRFSLRWKQKGDADFSKPDGYYADFQEDVGGDQDFCDFMRHAMTDALIMKAAYWLIELPPTDRNVSEMTKAEWDREGLGEARLCHIDREQVYDWECDDSGKLIWVVIHNIKCTRPKLTQDRDHYIETWSYYDRDNVQVFRAEYDGKKNRPKEVAVPAPVPHRFKELPLVCLHVPDGMWLAERLRSAQVEHFRMSCALGWSIRQTCYAMPVFNMESAESEPVMGSGYGIYLGLQEKMSWTAPPTAPFDILQHAVDSQRDEIYRISHQMALGLDNNADTVGRSADSKEFDVAATRVMLNAYGALVSKSIEETLEILSDARGDTDVTWSVEGFNGYDTTTAPELIANATNSVLLGIPSKTFHREIKTKTAMALLPEVDQNVRDTIKEEIKNATDKHGDFEEYGLPSELRTKLDIQTEKNKATLKVQDKKGVTANEIQDKKSEDMKVEAKMVAAKARASGGPRR